jgi:iron complex transport system ATP-binding protein
MNGPSRVRGDGDGDSGDESRASGAGTATSSLLDVRDLSVSYGDLAVLAGVSLSVERGEFVGLVGPNGAGKTTLLNVLNGMVEPDAGTVQVDGDPVTALSARATGRRVATVPQDTTVAFEFSVEDIVAMGRTPYHGLLARDTDGTAAVDHALARTETDQFRERAVGSLSGGERQRVVLARALAQGTPALLLDEPTASLDVNHQVRTLGLVRELTRDAGKGALAAIHDLDLAARFCDRIAVLADGQVLAVGSPAAVLTEETLETAFDTAAAVLPDPVTGTPTVTPLPARGDLALRVHVVGSGRAAARAIAALDESGATLTAGPLLDGDLAAVTAGERGVETVTAQPFASIPAESERRALEALGGAEVAVLAGSVSPDVHRLVRDHPCVVRMRASNRERQPDGEQTDPTVRVKTGERTALDVVATATPATVVETVRRVARSRVAADD